MRILAIMGSPHRGNTLELTRRFEEKMKRLGDVEFEYVHLKDVDLKSCRGCFLCFVQGEDKCPLEDDRREIARKLDAADGVVFVSPVYSMHVSYLMKAFIDRFAYNFHRPRYFDKYAIALAATGGIGLDDALDYLEMVAGSWGFNFVDRLGFVAPPKNTRIPSLLDREDRSDVVAEKFFRAISEDRPRKLSLSDHMMFRSMRAVYSRMETMSPADYTYWREQGWLEADARYFHDNVKLNPIKDLLARLMTWYMSRQIDQAITKNTS